MKIPAYLLTLSALFIHYANGVEVIVDTTQATDLANFGSKTKQTLEDWYVRVRDILYSPTYKEVSRINVFFDPNYDGVAYALPGQARIVGAVRYYREHQDDIGSMVHEMAHVIQNYPSGCPGWIVEGIADYVRYYKYEKRDLSKPGPSNNYTQGYGVAAYFLNYVVTKVRDDMVYYVNKDCREGTYKDDIWTRLTGKDTNTLWDDMQRGDSNFKVNVDTSQASDLNDYAVRVKKAMEDQYKAIRDFLNSPTFKDLSQINVKFDPNYDGFVAYSAQSGEIKASASYFRRNQKDTDIFIRIMIAMIQNYKNSPPRWIWSGIEDYVFNYRVKSRQLPKPSQQNNYDNGGTVSAYFMNYVVQKVRNDMIYWVNKDAREGTYADTIWPRLTGKDLKTLWADMQQNG